MSESLATASAGRVAARPSQQVGGRSLWLAVAGLLLAVVAATMLMLQFDLYSVRSAPMAESLLPGQRAVQVEVEPGDLQRGDVVSFRGGTWEGDPPDAVYAMRITGLPGDRVSADADGRLQVNGKPITEDYATADSRLDGKPFEVTVPPGRYFVMGDNRLVSLDSRARIDTANQGAIPVDLIEGRLIAVGLPVWKFHSLSPGEAFKAVGPTADGYSLTLLVSLTLAAVGGVLLFLFGSWPLARQFVRSRKAGRR